MGAPILTTADTARMLERNENTVRRWTDTGRLKAERTASGVRIFRRDEVEALAAELAAEKNGPPLPVGKENGWKQPADAEQEKIERALAPSAARSGVKNPPARRRKTVAA
jgi:hypothetical protein